MTAATPLVEYLAEQLPVAAGPELKALRDRLLADHGPAVGAMLFYGSCLRSGDAMDGLVDLYLVVDSYRPVYPKILPALFNWLLPPNVYYLEVPVEGGRVRCKYAVVSIRDLERGTSPKWFHSYLWGRFSQPCGLLYSRDSEYVERVQAALAQATLTFLDRVLPSLPDQLTTADIWQQGLALSYRAELRTEKPERALHLFQSWQQQYESITPLAMAQIRHPVEINRARDQTSYRLTISERTRRMNRLGWAIRRVEGKLLSVLRLVKSVFTFQGGIDYIAWKLERHTGAAIEITPKMRRHPLLYSWGLVWRLYRRDLFR